MLKSGCKLKFTAAFLSAIKEINYICKKITAMAKLVKEIYDKEGCEYGFRPSLSYIIMEEDGVFYSYDCRFGKYCSVSGFKEGTENVIIADEINVSGNGIKPVVEWGNFCNELEGANNIKSITLGKNLKEFHSSSMSGFEKLERLIIPESCNKFPSFSNCKNLREITLPQDISPDLNEYAWSHPKLQKVTLLNDGKETVIGARELEEKRLSYQRKVDAEEKAKEAEEKRKAIEEQREKKWGPIIELYLAIACGIPYLLAIINIFRKTVSLDIEFIDLIFELIATCCFAAGLLVAWAVAVTISYYIANYTKHRYVASFFTPILGIPLSWILFCIVLGVLSAFNSCSDGFYGIIDPRFL